MCWRPLQSFHPFNLPFIVCKMKRSIAANYNWFTWQKGQQHRLYRFMHFFCLWLTQTDLCDWLMWLGGLWQMITWYTDPRQFGLSTTLLKEYHMKQMLIISIILRYSENAFFLRKVLINHMYIWHYTLTHFQWEQWTCIGTWTTTLWVFWSGQDNLLVRKGRRYCGWSIDGCNSINI